MANFCNIQKLKNKEVADNQKLKSSMYLKKETYKKVDNILSLTDISSRNAAIEIAVDFYFAYITGELNQDYLCSVYGQKMEGQLRLLGDRLGRLQYKIAVELDILTRILSNDLDISKEQYDKLRKISVDTVKKQNGNINIFEAVQRNKK